MKKWFSKMGYKMQAMMSGRYGIDELSWFMNGAAMLLLLLSAFRWLRFLYIIAVLLVIVSYYRAFSKNIVKRQAERNGYLKTKYSILQYFRLIRSRWKDRKTHRYYVCPNCRRAVRIKYPGRGKKISIHCPDCGKSFIKKT